MKAIGMDDWSTSKHYRVHHHFCIPSISLRRVKKLAKKRGLMQKGSRPQWTNYRTSFSYSRKRKVLFIICRDMGPDYIPNTSED